MSVFIELTTDAFQAGFNQRTRDARESRRRAGATSVRRPLRGLEIKDDTNAVIKVITSDGQEIKLIDSGSESGMSTDYSNFILQSVQESRMEKSQIVETFGESYIYFFGESPRFLDVSAILVDSQDFNWYAEFWENYNLYLRGTRLVEMGARTYLFYDDNIVEGYMLQAQAVKTSDLPLMVRLTFRLYLTNYSNVTLVGDPNFPVRGSLIIPPSVGDVNLIDVSEGNLQATLGANLQQAGFAGGDQFSKALQAGGELGSLPPELWGLFVNASENLGALGGKGFERLRPLRNKIADNFDEFTNPKPSRTTGVEDIAGNVDEAQNFALQALQALEGVGADAGNPRTQNQLGLGPRFRPGGRVNVGINAGVSASASFGVSAGASFGARAGFGAQVGGGLGGGLGFSGRQSNGLNGGFVTASGSRIGNTVNELNASAFQDQIDINFADSFQTSESFSAGVRTSGGVTAGVGIGGGISGGASAGFALAPTRAGFASPGCGNGGASVNVGGTPSAFAIVSVSGTIQIGANNTSSASFRRSTF